MKNGKDYDILVVGELNVDLIMDRLNSPPQFGKEQRADIMTLTMGSSSAIFAANCASLGAKVAFCGKIGKDNFGDFVMDSLSSKRVNTDAVIVDEKLKTGATIIFNYDNDRMMVTHPGAMEQMTPEEIPQELFSKSRHIHTSAIFFQPGIKNNLVSLFKKAKNSGLTTSMDTQWDPEEKWDIDLKKLLPVLDFFLPNEQELLQLTAAPDIDVALNKISEYKTCIVVKRGTKGALMQKDGAKVSVPAFNVPDFIDAIGAGDSFNAGFIHEYLNGKDLNQCMKAGSLTAAVSTTAAGGTEGIESYQQVHDRKKTLEILPS